MGVKSTIGRRIESWDTAGRPVSPNAGRHGYNTELARFETWDSNESDWVAAGANISRPFLKTGQTDATNADSILPSDNILHPAKTNLGASEATQPFESQYNQKFYGNTKHTGVVVNTNYDIDETKIINVSVNPTTGSDSADITSYPSQTFQTLDKCFEWIQKCGGVEFVITLSGTSSGTRATLSASRTINDKHVRINTGFISMAASLSMTNGLLHLESVNITASIASCIVLRNNQLYVNGGTWASSVSGFVALFYNSRLCIRLPFTYTFSGNNQAIISNFTSGFGEIDIIGASSFTLSTGAYTGCSFLVLSTFHPIQINLLGAGNFYFLNSATWGNTIFYRGGYGWSIGDLTTNDGTKNMALHGAKAIYTPNQQSFENRAAAFAGSLINGEHYVDNLGYQKVMTSNPNDVKSWTTAGRPVDPYLGMDGFNTTDSVREYWNGTNWIQY
jgi:hypothetical protein